MTKQKSSQHVSVKAMETLPKGKGTIITACLTAPVTDSDGEVYDTDTMQIPLKGGGYVNGSELNDSQDLNIPIVTNHDLETGQINRDVRQTIGRVMSGHLNDARELITKLYFSSIEEAQKIATLIEEGVLDDCLSLVYWHYGEASDGVIYNAEPFQLGVVWKSANQRARVIASSKSLKTEGDDVSKRDAETIKKELAAKQAESEALEAELKEAEAETPVEPEQLAPEVTEEKPVTEETPTATPTPVEEDDDKEEVPVATPTNDQDKEEPGESEESVDPKQTAAKSAATKPNADVKQPTTHEVDETRAKELAVKSMQALRNGDSATFAGIQKELSKVVDSDVAKRVSAKDAGRLAYGDIEDTFTQALIDQDFARLYKEAGGVASRVSKKTLTGNNPIYRKRLKKSRYAFAPAPYGGNKKVQHVLPEYAEFKVQPWAVIAAWDEEAAEDAPFDFFQDVNDDLLESALANEEFMIVGFDGGTFGGRTYERTGILAIAKEATERVTNPVDMYTQYTANSTFTTTLATVLGNVRSTRRNARYSLVMSRTTLASLAGIQDADGKLLFTGGSTLDLGLLGTVDIVEVDAELVPGNQIIVGDLAMYQEVEKGGVKLLGSQHATLDTVSLYQSDGEALRARQRIGGGLLFNEAFHVLGTGTAIVLPTQPTA